MLAFLHNNGTRENLHSPCTPSVPTSLGEDIYFAKDWLGHKNIQNTVVYSRFSTATLRRSSQEIIFQQPSGLMK